MAIVANNMQNGALMSFTVTRKTTNQFVVLLFDTAWKFQYSNSTEAQRLKGVLRATVACNKRQGIGACQSNDPIETLTIFLSLASVAELHLHQTLL